MTAGLELPFAGRQRRSVEDVRPESGARRGSGSHRRGSCDLANRSSESEPSKTSPALLPRREVQACQQRQVPLQKCLQRARMEMQATIRGCRRGLFYIRIESTAETILTDFFSSLSFFFFFRGGEFGCSCLFTPASNLWLWCSLPPCSTACTQILSFSCYRYIIHMYCYVIMFLTD